MTPMQRYAIQTGKFSPKYMFLYTSDDIYDNFILSHMDLSYPLRKEVKRDRYILNSQGLKKDIEKVVDESLEKVTKPLIDLVSTEIAAESYAKLEAIHNGNTSRIIKNTSKINNIGNMLGKLLGKSLVEGITAILDDN